MQAVNKLSSYVSNKSFMIFATVMNLLSVGMFSFSLICKSIAAQFLTVLCSGRWENSCGERFSFTEDNKKFVGQPTLVMFHLFLVGATFSELVNLLLTLSNCVLKQRRNILQFIIWSAWLGFLPLWGTGTGLVGILPLPLIFDLPENTTLPMETMHKTLWNYWIQRSPQDALYSCVTSHWVYQIYKEGGVLNRFSTPRRHFQTPWSEQTHCMENGQSIFLLSPQLVRFAHVRLLRYSNATLNRFWEKTHCFAVFIGKHFKTFYNFKAT